MYNNSMFSMMFCSWMRVCNFKVNQKTKDTIGSYYRQFMSHYEIWYEENEDEERIRCAESGANREYKFDFDDHMEDLYEELGKMP